jgi:putative membrane protein
MISQPARALFVGLAVLGLSGAAVAQKNADALPHGDAKFLQKAAADGLAEVELGRLAQQKAVHEEVKQFAGRMVEDHGKANQELTRVASTNSVTIPTALDKKHQKDLEKLSKQVGPDFDREYMKHMLKDHRKDVKEFREHAKSRKPNDATRFAAATLPTLEDHLRAAMATNDIVQGSKRTGNRETGSTKK